MKYQCKRTLSFIFHHFSSINNTYFILAMILLSIKYYRMKSQTCCEAETENHGSSKKDSRVTKCKQ